MLKRAVGWFRSFLQLVSTHRVRVYIIFFGLTVAVYTALFHHYYPILEGRPLSWTESLQFVMQTLTTVGYGELLPFENELTSLFSILMMATGVVMIFMVVPLILTPYLSRLVRDTPPRRTTRPLEDHIVIIGFNETVRSLIEGLRITDRPVVIVTEDEETAIGLHRRYLWEVQVHVIWGNPMLTSTQEAAIIGRARSVVVTGEIRTTANLILAVRGRTSARVIAVVDDPAFDRYLRYAGADTILSPEHSTGLVLARYGLAPQEQRQIPDPADRSQEHLFWIVKAPILRGSPAIGRTLGELALFEKHGVLPLILWRGGIFEFMPGPDEVVDASAMLFLIGRAADIEQLMALELCVRDGTERKAVITGFGDVGATVYRELMAHGIRCTVVDPRELPFESVVGDAEEEAVLLRTGIEDAHLLVATVNDDEVNIFTVLMARNLNPSLKILARANHPGAVDRLYRAGANFVALQPTIGGQVITSTVLGDQLQVLLDLPDDRRIVKVPFMRTNPRSVRWLESRTGTSVIGIEGTDRSILRPYHGELLREGDQIILVGGVKELRRALRLI
ncbi:MAG TPA: NAD-binding protein [Methanoregulaceae archaeon]|nr:NAD-binding protein [Methanoregulaceae archaeon]HQJ87007.1 NAD-binding protein [Methanoregulaceae archaeon]